MNCKGILNISKLFFMHSNNKKLAEAIGCLETSARISAPAPHDCWVLAPCVPKLPLRLRETGSRELMAAAAGLRGFPVLVSSRY